VLEPHGAVGWAGLERYWHDCVGEPEPLAVSVETAHPAKFPEEIRTLIGVEPDTPPSLVGLDERPESYETLPAEYEPFRDLLLERFKRP
jgi:threonine synthase